MGYRDVLIITLNKQGVKNYEDRIRNQEQDNSNM